MNQENNLVAIQTITMESLRHALGKLATGDWFSLRVGYLSRPDDFVLEIKAHTGEPVWFKQFTEVGRLHSKKGTIRLVSNDIIYGDVSRAANGLMRCLPALLEPDPAYRLAAHFGSSYIHKQLYGVIE